MGRLRISVKLLVKVLFIFIVSNLILSILKEYILIWLKGRELWILEEFIKLCSAYWWVLALISATISGFLFYDWVMERKDEFRKIWEVYKPAEKLTPEDSKIQGYKKAYVSRKSDTTIENLLENGKYILIVGKPKIGKTRTAYEAIKKFKGFSVIKPGPKEIEKIRIPPLCKKNFILFLDELQRFVDKNIEDVIAELKKKVKKLVVIATCRTEKELDLVKEEILTLYREFTSIELEKISKDDCKRLADSIKNEDRKFEWEPDQFDGTPGCVTLDLEDMKKRYKKAGDCKAILKALKLLKEGNLFLYKETRVKDVCRDIFEFPIEKLRRYIWDELIQNLKESGFITMDEDIIDIYASYLDKCVYDYDPSLNDLMRLKNTLIRTKDSRSLFYLGSGFYYKKDFSHAINCYVEALKVYPKYAAAHNSLGYVSAKLGEVEEAEGRYDKARRLYEEAEKEHREAIRLNPYYAVDHNNLGFALTRLGVGKEIEGEYGEARRLYEEAEKEHREAIRLKPEYASAHHSLAYVLGKLERYIEAEKEYKEAIRLNPESPFAHNLLGHLLVQLGRYEEAEKEYKEAIKIKSDYPSAHNNFGYLLAKLGRYEEAEKEYRAAIGAFRDYVVAYANLGHLLCDCGRYEEAEKECRIALNINPEYVEVHVTLGYALVNLTRYEKAEEEYRVAIRLKPDCVKAFTNLGWMFGFRGKNEDKRGIHAKAKRLFDKAEKEYRKALQINPNEEDALIGFGIIMEKLNRDKEAEDCYKKAIAINPENVKARTTYGYFLSYRGRGKEAKEEFNKVINIDPNDAKARSQLMFLEKQLPFIHANRAKALIESGKRDEAEWELGKAISLDPDNAFVHKTFGALKEIRGDKAQSEWDRKRLYEEAEKEYRKALELNPTYPSARRHLANLLAKLGRYREAESEYKEGKKITKKYPKNNMDFGIFLSKLGRKEEAKEEHTVAIKLFRKQGREEDAKKAEEILKKLS